MLFYTRPMQAANPIGLRGLLRRYHVTPPCFFPAGISQRVSAYGMMLVWRRWPAACGEKPNQGWK
jgi:hypothetical protein